MVIEVRKQVCDGRMFKWLLVAGLAWLRHNQEQVNRMNVFPVPDGDTGTNMRLTLEKAYDMIMESEETHVGIMTAEIARGALRGARGNSGVILSQLFSGFADGLRGHEVFDVKILAAACQNAVDVGYQAVIEPTEGTILTVAREAAEELNEYARNNGDSLLDALDILLDSARNSLARTPDLLPVLKRAGVFDSGGQGLVFILEGMQRMLDGMPVNFGDENSSQNRNQPHWEDDLPPIDEEGYGYDVQFLMMGQNLDVTSIRADIDAMGWSTLVVGDAELIKVHVHVHDPGVPLSYAIQSGATIDDIVVENMQLQYERQSGTHRRKSDQRKIRSVDDPAVIVVSNGDGFAELFYDGLGAAALISGGQSMNPSAEDFTDIIDKLDNNQIILLPNNRNVILSAQQAANLANDRDVRVIPTTSLPQGIAAMLSYMDEKDGSESLDELVESMQAALSHLITCEVTRATRDASLDGLDVQQGQFIGLVNDELKTTGSTLETVIMDVLKQANAETRELITLYYGDEIRLSEAETMAEHIRQAYPQQQIELVHGGQPLYLYIISVE